MNQISISRILDFFDMSIKQTALGKKIAYHRKQIGMTLIFINDVQLK